MTISRGSVMPVVERTGKIWIPKTPDWRNGSRARWITSSVELGKFDPPLWHAPYGRIV